MTVLSNQLVEDVVTEVAGKDVVPLVKILRTKENQSEFKLAERIKREVNITRNMLYRLYNYNLVSFTRKKDKVKGWYIYYWTFNSNRVKDLLVKLKNNKLEKLQERLKREEHNQFYLCSNNCIRLDFDQAADFEFKCPECGTLLDQQNNERTIEHLQKEIGKLQKELAKA